MAEQPPSAPTRSHSRHREHRHDREPARIELTEEEKSVLLECRRNSTARGIPLGVGSVLLLRWFVKQGRVPLHVQRWSGLYYTGAFFASFFFGVTSYKHKCFEKIMALENSRLADQVREHFAKGKGYGKWDEGYKREESETTIPTVPGTQRRYPPRHHPPSIPVPSPSQDKATHYSEKAPGYSSGGKNYESISPQPSQEQPVEQTSQEPPFNQPDAFGNSTPSGDPEVWGMQETTPTRQRTFDDLREESRRRQLQHPRGGVGREEEYVEQDWRKQQQEQRSGKVVRRNKYGDVVYEE